MASIVPETSRGQLVAFQFAQDAVAASQTNVQLVTPGETTTPLTDGYVVPWPGEVVALTWALDTAGSAGVFTIGATVGGTEDADTTVTVGTAASGSQKVARGLCKFVAGDKIGAEITTDGSWDGTTSDLIVTVWALVYMSGI